MGDVVMRRRLRLLAPLLRLRRLVPHLLRRLVRRLRQVLLLRPLSRPARLRLRRPCLRERWL